MLAVKLNAIRANATVLYTCGINLYSRYLIYVDQGTCLVMCKVKNSGLQLLIKIFALQELIFRIADNNTSFMAR